MFNPTRDQVRAFFAGTWQKYRRSAPLEGLEQVAIGLLLDHPEYHALLEEGATPAEPAAGEPNPFLHLSMHLALEEQHSIDQPPGVRAALDRLSERRGHHEGRHEAMECLGEMLWTAQRNGTPPDGQTYLEGLRQRASAR
jgi:hypothetical protein